MIINSILDQDQYKLVMQQAVIKLFPNVKVKYKFFNRGKTKFPPSFSLSINNAVEEMLHLTLKYTEYQYLLENCPYFERWYLDFLRGYQYDPEEVKITQDKDFNIEIEGYWYSAILWEVPLMAIISELYNVPKAMRTSTDWDFNNPIDTIVRISKDITIEKAEKFEKLGIKYADFGTRRRFSYTNHMNVLDVLKKYSPNSFIGTSNLRMAYLFDLKPIGTVAHEWYMLHASKYGGYINANVFATNNWKKVYSNKLDVALTDTFTSETFFDRTLPIWNSSYRQDSGDPIEFGYKFIDWCKKHGCDPKTKTVIFSDNLNYDKVKKIYKEFKGKFNISFGIGTNLTNDVGTDPLNMVIKLVEADGVPCIKLSDDPGKESGDLDEIKKAKKELGLL